MPYTESDFENAIIELLRDELGYTYFYGPDLQRDYRDPLIEDQLYTSLQDVNPALPDAALQEALFKIKNFEVGSLVQKNETFMDYLQNGVEVNYFDGKEQRHALVGLIDYEHQGRNNFAVVNQWTIEENSVKRADVVIFVNGLPLVVVELKSPSREETDASEAFRQLRNYMHEIPSLFIYNAFCIMSDQAVSKAGSITAGEDRFMEWKTSDGHSENHDVAGFDILFEGMLEKSRLLDIVRNFICFSNHEKGKAKILAAYHQYYAVKKAVESTQHATMTDGKAGVFWHTQGSGKSLSMVFYAGLLEKQLQSPTIVVITDRNDLDTQLYGQFSDCSDFLRQVPQQAESRENLKELLAGRMANGIIFTTMQKFEESAGPLSERHNIIVMADEAHRGQYGFEEKVDPSTGKISIGTARIIRDSLPHATFIGFTGTPVSTKDHNTREVFGNYIDIYDMTQSVRDKATRPVFYESRVVNLKLNEDVLKLIDREYDMVSEEAEAYQVEKSKQEMGRLESLLGAPETIDSLCRDIIGHYERFRQYEQAGKAMIVAYSRAVAMEIYRKVLELRPSWKEKIAVVMTSGNNDPEDWHDIIGNKAHKQELATKFKDNQSPLKIAIVVDMWLTGFDVPSLSTMYFYKPMAGHNLMQAIARVNRVYKDKEGGLIVDYIGIAGALKQAMNDYTVRDKKNYGEQDISKTAFPEFIEKLGICRDFFHGYDYSAFMNGSDLQRAKAISGGVNFLTAPDKESVKQDFIGISLQMHQCLSLCSSLLDQEQRYEAAFFTAVRTLLTRITSPRKLSLKEINERINELLKQSIQSEGVINLFADVKKEFSLFDPAFLEEIARMKEHNLAVELLKKLIEGQISSYRQTNVVKSEKFSEKMKNVMNSYLKGLLTNEEVIEELLKMAQDMKMAHQEGEKLGLSEEETAFYDALTKPEAIKDFYTNDQLIAVTRELTDALRKNKTIDWQIKESARAGMRKMVKHLLKKYNYPPAEIQGAISTVLTQCEKWTDKKE